MSQQDDCLDWQLADPWADLQALMLLSSSHNRQVLLPHKQRSIFDLRRLGVYRTSDLAYSSGIRCLLMENMNCHMQKPSRALLFSRGHLE